MTRRRTIWIIHNAAMTPFVPIRIFLVLCVCIGNVAAAQRTRLRRVIAATLSESAGSEGFKIAFMKGWGIWHG